MFERGYLLQTTNLGYPCCKTFLFRLPSKAPFKGKSKAKTGGAYPLELEIDMGAQKKRSKPGSSNLFFGVLNGWCFGWCRRNTIVDASEIGREHQLISYISRCLQGFIPVGRLAGFLASTVYFFLLLTVELYP